ncbi:MAG: N-formylglutamate deformylase [Pararhodobacter sp.]
MQDGASTSFDNPVFHLTRGASPLVLAIPHAGTFVPDYVRDALNDLGRGLADTDWHIDRLYDGLAPGATIIAARFHRYVIDANRDPGGHSLYPGQNTTGLVPLTDFDGAPLWRVPPTEADIEARRRDWHAPYHAALEAELARVRAIHGYAILFDCHSIRSKIPFLFDGRLPDMNIGTNRGATCAPELEAITRDHCAAATGYTHVLNGRFLGGWTTRHYGRPVEGLHAIQMELAQTTYMQESPPWDWVDDRAASMRAVLGPMLAELAAWRPGE